MCFSMQSNFFFRLYISGCFLSIFVCKFQPYSTFRAQIVNPDLYDSESGSDSDDLLRLISRDPESCDPDEDESNLCFLADKFTKPKYKWHVSKEVINRQYGKPVLSFINVCYR